MCCGNNISCLLKWMVAVNKLSLNVKEKINYISISSRKIGIPLDRQIYYFNINRVCVGLHLDEL